MIDGLPLAVPNRYVGADLPLVSAYPAFHQPVSDDMSSGCKIHERLNRHGFWQSSHLQGLSTWRQYRNLGKRGTNDFNPAPAFHEGFILEIVQNEQGQTSLLRLELFNWACRVPEALRFVGLNRPAPVPLVMAPYPFCMLTKRRSGEILRKRDVTPNWVIYLFSNVPSIESTGSNHYVISMRPITPSLFIFHRSCRRT